MATATPPMQRTVRILVFIAAGMVVISLISIFANLIGAFFGNSGRFNEGVWPIIALIPIIALPLAFVLMIVVFVINVRRLSRDA